MLFLTSCFIRLACYNTALNTTLIHSSQDFEKSFISPALVPRVCYQPVVLSILIPVSNNLDSMASKLYIRLPHVNTTFVTWKIIINGESGFYWSIQGYFLFDVSGTLSGVNVGTIVLVLGKRSTVLTNTLV